MCSNILIGDSIGQSAKCYPHRRQFLLPHKLMRGEHHRGFLFCLYLFFDSFGAGAVEGGVGAS